MLTSLAEECEGLKASPRPVRAGKKGVVGGVRVEAGYACALIGQITCVFRTKR